MAFLCGVTSTPMTIPMQTSDKHVYDTPVDMSQFMGLHGGGNDRMSSPDKRLNLGGSKGKGGFDYSGVVTAILPEALDSANLIASL